MATTAVDHKRLSWPFPSSARNPHSVRIHFVHVGKAGGTTLRDTLRLEEQNFLWLPCRIRQTKTDGIDAQDSCWTDYNGTSLAIQDAIPHTTTKKQEQFRDALKVLPRYFEKDHRLDVYQTTRQTYYYRHMSRGIQNFRLAEGTEDWLRDHTNLLVFSIRDPIDRIVSAYKYHYPSNDNSLSQHGISKAFFQTCFPTVSHLARLVDPRRRVSNSSSTKQQQECQVIGRELLTGRHYVHQLHHFYYNFEYYTSQTWDQQHREKPIAVIRTSHLWHDVARLEGFLGGDAAAVMENAQVRLNGSAQHPSLTNPEEIVSLCCVLHRELAVYQKLVLAATNLYPEEKYETLMALHHKCNTAQHLTEDVEYWDWPSWYDTACQDF